MCKIDVLQACGIEVYILTKKKLFSGIETKFYTIRSD